MRRGRVGTCSGLACLDVLAMLLGFDMSPGRVGHGRREFGQWRPSWGNACALARREIDRVRAIGVHDEEVGVLVTG